MSSRTVVTAQEGSSAMDVGVDFETEADIDERIDDEAEAADEADLVDAEEASADRVSRFSWTRFVAVGVLPAVALLLALGDAYLRWLDGSAHASRVAAEESVKAATDSTIAILSYRPDTVDRDLTGAVGRLTGGFRQQYTQLVTDVVAPGAKQQHISAVATVPAAASVSATENHAVVLVFIDQTTTIGNDAPTQTTSSVRITLDKVHDRWLISQFDPV
jgi:Mce-associated membrane protein